MRNTQKKGIVTIAVIAAVVVMLVVAVIGVVGTIGDKAGHGYEPGDITVRGKSMQELYEAIEDDILVAEPVKASIDLSDASLYDELPEIDKYPLGIEARADIVLEVFSSPEKAGERANNESWLIDVVKDFNKSGVVTSSGRTCGISVRNVSSGLAADYIISGKYVPELFSPSNSLWGALIQSNGSTANMECERLIGNTAGVMVKKSLGYSDIDSIIEAVVAGELNLGYTNPQVSSAGMNMLLTILDKYGNGDFTSDKAVQGFTKFQQNIPYVAYNTVQMVSSAGTGALDCMVAEYQAYTNNTEFVRDYDFIPYGVRHDNPLYSCKTLIDDERECLEKFIEFALAEDAQKLATQFGFNGNVDYKDAFEAPSGGVVEQSGKIWKTNKDVGKDIVAVFVADCSGSMAGDAINELKASLTNGMKYINENNYIGLVSYSSVVTKELDIAQFDLQQKSFFQGAVNRLQANGNTYTYEAICLAMKMIKDSKELHPDAKCMIFLLSDGQANGSYSMKDVQFAVMEQEVPIYTIGYGSGADMNELGKLSNINEAASISADSEDIVYKIRSLFNAQL